MRAPAAGHRPSPSAGAAPRPAPGRRTTRLPWPGHL